MTSETPLPEDVLVLEHTKPLSGELYDLTADHCYDRPIAEVCGDSDEELLNQARKAAEAAGWVITGIDGEFQHRYYGPPHWIFQGYRGADTTSAKEATR